MKAVERFNPAKGAKLSTYAPGGSNRRSAARWPTSPRPSACPFTSSKISDGQAEARLREVLGREATDEELAEEIGITPKRVIRLRSSAIRTISPHTPLGDEDKRTILEVIGDDRTFDLLTAYQRKTDHEIVTGTPGAIAGKGGLEVPTPLRVGWEGRENVEETRRRIGPDARTHWRVADGSVQEAPTVDGKPGRIQPGRLTETREPAGQTYC